MNIEMIEKDSQGEMTLFRQIAKIWLATCEDEQISYQDREILRTFESVATSEHLSLVEALVENLIQTR